MSQPLPFVAFPSFSARSSQDHLPNCSGPPFSTRIVNNHLKWDLTRAVHAHLTGLHNNRFTALRASESGGYSEAEKGTKCACATNSATGGTSGDTAGDLVTFSGDGGAVLNLALASGLCQTLAMAKKRTKADRLERQIEQPGKKGRSPSRRDRERAINTRTEVGRDDRPDPD